MSLLWPSVTTTTAASSRNFPARTRPAARLVVPPTRPTSTRPIFFAKRSASDVGSQTIAARSAKTASAVAYDRVIADRAKPIAPFLACSILNDSMAWLRGHVSWAGATFR